MSILRIALAGDMTFKPAEQIYPQFTVREPVRACNELFYFAGEFATNCGVSFHQFAALVIRKRVPIALLAASFAHIIEAYYRQIGQRGINAFLPITFHPLAKGFHRFSELL